MRIVVLGAGAIGVATAWYLSKAGHDVMVVERQNEAALETSWGNGGIIHTSEAAPWSQPGMPLKIVKCLGKENAPLLLRYGAILQMWRWGIDFARNCAADKFGANARANLELALYSLRSLQEIGEETGIAYDRATNGVLKIYRSKQALDSAQRSCDMLAQHGLRYDQHHLPFELREAGEDGENELASCAFGIDRLAAEIQHPKSGPAILDCLKPLDDLPKANRRASQSVDLGGNQRIAPAHVVQGGKVISGKNTSCKPSSLPKLVD